VAAHQPDERAFRRHMRGARFQVGVDRGDWRCVRVRWPLALIAVSASPRPGSPDEVVLRFTLDGYPVTAPTAAPWDPKADEPLPDDLWPHGGRTETAFNPGWRRDALYIPYDRIAIDGHDGWQAQHPAFIWSADKDITDYLELVHDLLHARDYQGVRRSA
jgi:hypothetical protein